MSLQLIYPASHAGPAEYRPTDPVECTVCGWVGDRDHHQGDYSILEGIPEAYLYAMSGDGLCFKCTLKCSDCGESLIDRGVFIGAWGDETRLLCWDCMADALCPESQVRDAPDSLSFQARSNSLQITKIPVDTEKKPD